ncbi:MAG: hypothetical protein NTW94_05185 [Legionellales bacterium]|nr:hypothetical protein [Legionellales bacterium]
MKKYLSLIYLLCFIVTPNHANTQPKFGLVASTQTTVTVPANRHALVQYRVTNRTSITRTLTMVPIPNVVQRTDDPSQCSNPFVLAPNQSCNLTLFINGATQQRAYSGGPVVCKTQAHTNIPDPFLCSQPASNMVLTIFQAPPVAPTTNKLYVSNWSGDSISLCYLHSGNLVNCLVSAVSGTFLNPEALAINDGVLFVANIGGGISSCVIDPVTGDLSTCQNAVTTPNPPIFGPDGIAILGGQAFIADSGPASLNQGVTVCDISGQFLTNCTFTKGDASFSVPSDLAIADHTVYVTNFNSLTTYCTVADPLCTTASGEGSISGTASLLNEPEGLFMTSINSVQYAYFTNHGNNTIVLCTVLSSTDFSNCLVTGGYFTGFGNLTLLNSELKGYIPSGLNSINICDVNVSDGTLSNCLNSTESAFNNPSGMVIQ